jgi:hypothetical protein
MLFLLDLAALCADDFTVVVLICMCLSLCAVYYPQVVHRYLCSSLQCGDNILYAVLQVRRLYLFFYQLL